MPWSHQQIALWKQAVKTAPLTEQQERMILEGEALRERAYFPAKRRVSAASPKLTQADFEHAMAIVEQFCGGQLRVTDVFGRRRYGLHHWSERAGDPNQRLRHLAKRIANTLEVAGHLEPHGKGLEGWITQVITRDKLRNRLDQLDTRELYDLIEGLKDFGRRKGLRWEDEQLPGEAGTPACSASD